MRNKLFVLLFLSFATTSFSQENQFTDEEIEINKFVSGSLLVPPSEENVPLVVFIQGSG